jgi:hypothetical protein
MSHRSISLENFFPPKTRENSRGFDFTTVIHNHVQTVIKHKIDSEGGKLLLQKRITRELC